MANETPVRAARSLSLDRWIGQMRDQLSTLSPFLADRGAGNERALDEFDTQTDRLIREALGDTSEMVEAYEYAQLGEAGGLVNVPDEAPEGGATTRDQARERLNQRKRVIESCIAELEASRAEAAMRAGSMVDIMMGPQVVHHMTPEPRSVHVNATLREAARMMQQWGVGSLLVTDDRAYVGLLTDSDLARAVVARGLDAETTKVKATMREPLVTIEGERPILEAVRMMKDQATRHLAVVDRGEVIGVISVSNVLRYYSGVI